MARLRYHRRAMAEERTLTPRQLERRQRVLRATLELAAEGGYEGVQMRAVAERADVALGTVYHYFSSKDHLLAESLIEWLRQLDRMVEEYPAVGSTTEDRVLDLLRRVTRAVARNEQVSAALIGGLVAEGPQGATCQAELHVVFARMFAGAFDASVEPVERDHIIRTLEHVWFSCLVAWKNDWMPLDQAVNELENSAAVLLVGRS